MGGLQQKILNLVLIFLLAIILVFGAVAFYQNNLISSIVKDASGSQQEAITSVSENTMHQVIEGSLIKTTALQAYIADDLFADVKTDVLTLQTLAKGLFEHKDSFEPYPFYPPDAANDGKTSVQVLCEEGVDYTKSELLGVAAHMSDTMTSMYDNSGKLSSVFIGLSDGTHIMVDDKALTKFDDKGNINPFPVRERPWYKGAVEKKELYFTGIEIDAFTGTIGVVCAAPVYANGKLVGVVGADLFLDSMAQYVNASSSSSGFLCVVNDNGQVIFAPENNGLFSVETSDKAVDLRTSDNTALAGFISEGLNGRTGLNTISVGGKEYYMAAAPMGTVGWTVVSVVDKEITEQPTKMMISKYDDINADSVTKFRNGLDNSTRTTLIMIAVVLILGSIGALVVAGRIVKPIERMTKRINEISGSDQEFEMEDAYRTGDEIEVFAESFADLSKKTRQYIIDITEITKEKERIGTELELAHKIQANMLPSLFPAFPDRPEFDIYASMDPAKEVGGDFYDFFLIDDDHLGMVMADVSGKGVPAALFMMMSKILIHNFAMMKNSPAKVLELTNSTICQNNDEEMFVTVWFGILEISTGMITAANAGHEFPVIRKADGNFELFMDKHGFVVGGMDGMKYKEYQIKLEKGGSIFLYTDGVPESTNAQNELFGTDRLLEAMNKNKDSTPKDLVKNIRASIDEFVGEADQFDDLTMLVLSLF